MVADGICFAALRRCGRVAVAASEEKTAEADLGGSDFSVAFDPLDGSSVAGAGWAVGAIFGVWPGRGLVGRAGDGQVAATYALFGPRVTLVVAARPRRRRRACSSCAQTLSAGRCPIMSA